jgi:FtsZ-binding cell division protein ZapB
LTPKAVRAINGRPWGHLQTGKQIRMSDSQNSSDTRISKLDSALARIDRVIDSVSKKLDEQRYEHRTVVEERDSARAELEELRRKYDELQSKADHAADRIEVLIGIVERSFPEIAGSVSGDFNGGDLDGGGQFNQGDQNYQQHDGGHQPQQSYGY